MVKKSTPAQKIEKLLRDFAMKYPEAHEDFPWGERAIKVRSKVFLFMRCDDNGLSLSVKLPESLEDALSLPFTEPTHYGLGKHGWVTATFRPATTVPTELLQEWIAESYRAVAPKKLVAELKG